LYKLGIPKEKREFFFKMDIPADQLKRLGGGRGAYSWYAPDDIEIPREQQLGHGKC
jgi:hypothetical protein